MDAVDYIETNGIFFVILHVILSGITMFCPQWSWVVGGNHHSEHSDHPCTMKASITAVFSRQFLSQFCIGITLEQWLCLLHCKPTTPIQIHEDLTFFFSLQPPLINPGQNPVLCVKSHQKIQFTLECNIQHFFE